MEEFLIKVFQKSAKIGNVLPKTQSKPCIARKIKNKIYI